MSGSIDELKKVCEPLIEYLEKNCDPHTCVVVSHDAIKLQNVLIGVPLTDKN